MAKYKFEYTIQSTVGGTVVIEAEDEYDACEKFELMKDELICENAEDVQYTGNFRVCDDPYYEKIDE